MGITLATTKLLNDRTVTNLKTDEYNVDYQGDKDIVIEKLEPIDDEKINIADVTSILSIMAGNQSDSLIREAADVNDDGAINVADVTSVLSIMAGNK